MNVNRAGGNLNYASSVQQTDRSVSADNRTASSAPSHSSDAVTQRITTENYREVLGANADALLSPQDMKQLFEEGHLDVQRSMSMQESSEGFLTITSKLAAALIGPSKSIGAISIDPLFMEMIKDPNAEIGAGFTRVYNEELTVLPSSRSEQPSETPPSEPNPSYTPPTRIGAIDYDWRETPLDDAPDMEVPTTTTTETTDAVYMRERNVKANADGKSIASSSQSRTSEDYNDLVKKYEQDGAAIVFNAEGVLDYTWAGAQQEGQLQDRDLAVRNQFTLRSNAELSTLKNSKGSISVGSLSTMEGLSSEARSLINKHKGKDLQTLAQQNPADFRKLAFALPRGTNPRVTMTQSIRAIDYANKQTGSNFNVGDVFNGNIGQVQDAVAQSFGFPDFKANKAIQRQSVDDRAIAYVSPLNSTTGIEDGLAKANGSGWNGVLESQHDGVSTKQDGTNNWYDTVSVLENRTFVDKNGKETGFAIYKEDYPDANNLYDVYLAQSEQTPIPEENLGEYAELYNRTMGLSGDQAVTPASLKEASPPPNVKDMYALITHQWRPGEAQIDTSASANGKVAFKAGADMDRVNKFVMNTRIVVEGNNGGDRQFLYDNNGIKAMNAQVEYNFADVEPFEMKDNTGQVVVDPSAPDAHEQMVHRLQVHQGEDSEILDTFKEELGTKGEVKANGKTIATLDSSTGDITIHGEPPQVIKPDDPERDAKLTEAAQNIKINNNKTGQQYSTSLEGGVGYGFIDGETTTSSRTVVDSDALSTQMDTVLSDIQNPEKHYSPEAIGKFNAYVAEVEQAYEGQEMPAGIREKLDAIKAEIPKAAQRSDDYVAQGPNKEAAYQKIEENTRILGEEGAFREVDGSPVMSPENYDNIQPKIMEDVLEATGIDISAAKELKGDKTYGAMDAFPPEYTAAMKETVLNHINNDPALKAQFFGEGQSLEDVKGNQAVADKVVDDFLAFQVGKDKPELGETLKTNLANARAGVQEYRRAQELGTLPKDTSVTGITQHVKKDIDNLNAYVGQAVRDGTITKDEINTIRKNLDTTADNMANTLGISKGDMLALDKNNYKTAPGLENMTDEQRLEVLNTVDLLRKSNANINLAAESGSLRDSLNTIKTLKKDLDEFETVKVITNAFKGEMQSLATDSPERFKTLMRATYFPNSEPTAEQEQTIQSLLERAQAGDIPLPPNIQFADSSDLNGGHAAYAKGGPDGPTILLNRDLLDQPGALSEALAEEMFHHMETLIRTDGSDTDGDEGDGGMSGMRVAMRGGSDEAIRAAVEQGRNTQGPGENGSDHQASLTVGGQTYTDIEFRNDAPVAPTETQDDAPVEDMSALMNQGEEKPGFFSTSTLMGALMGLNTPEGSVEGRRQRYDMFQTELYDKNNLSSSPLEKKSTRTPLQDIMQMLQMRSENLKQTWSKIAKEGLSSVQGTQAEQVINHGFDVGRGANEDSLRANLATKTASNYDVNPNYGDAHRTNSAKYNDYYGNAAKQRQAAESMGNLDARMQARAEAQNNQRTSG